MINSTPHQSRSNPLFAHEPLLAGVTIVCEPFCGLGNLVIAMRERGLTVHASDIVNRGCPDSTVLDFLKMTDRPLDCDVLLSNPPFSIAMKSSNTHGGLGFAWSYFSWSRRFCSLRTDSNAFTRAATCAASIRSRSDCLVQRMVQRPC